MSARPMTLRTLYVAMLCFYAGLILWLGSLAFFGIGVAPVIFKVLPSKDLAGGLNAVILHRLNMVEIVGAACVGVSFAFLLGQSRDKRAWHPALAPLALWGVMILVWCIYALVLSPQMNALRTQISSFDAPDATSQPLVLTFRGYHRWYSRLVGINIITGLALLAWQTWQFIVIARASDSAHHA